jgi:hypothetical protein
VGILENNIIKLIQSSDYKERLQGEYFELLTRHNVLANMICKYNRGTLEFAPNTPIEILRAQLDIMESYLSILDYRIKNFECVDNWSSD